MKNLFIKHIKTNKSLTLTEAGHLLETNAVSVPIDTLNWKEFGYRPKLSFRIAHVENEILLKYYIGEKHILAQETHTNGAVYKDSCVEFFVSFDGSNYYNFEFSCIGTRHLAFGMGRGNRTLLDPKIVEQIKIESSLGNQPFEEKAGNFEWEMMVRIPVSCFEFNKLKSFTGLKATANFYKCGDATSEPHYVTWNPVGTEHPDYHRPEYFGKVEFE